MMTPHYRLFRHPRIYMLDASRNMASWMLTLGDRIIALGSQDTKPPRLSGDIEEIHLPGAAVSPGFTDAHTHLGRYLFPFAASMLAPKENLDNQESTFLTEAEIGWLDLANTTPPKLSNLIQQKASKLPAGSWICGGGWDPGALAPIPDIAQLDSMAPHHPLFLIDFSLHAALVNTCALQKAQIHQETWDPRGGRLERNRQTGRLTGRVYETAIQLFEHCLPQMPSFTKFKLLPLLMNYLNSLGIVGIHEMECSAHYDIFPALATLLSGDPDSFSVRCVCSLKYTTWQESLQHGLVPGLGNEYLRIGFLKLIHDGSLGAGTAHMSRPYHLYAPNALPSWGQEVVSRGELQHVVRQACLRSIPVAVHGIGDRATQNIAEIFEELGYSPTHRPLRHRIEHVQSATPETIRRLAQCGLVFSVQPLHLLGDMPRIQQYQPWLVPHTHAYRAMLNACAEFQTALALGTDFPVVSLNPLWTLYAAVTRKFTDNTGLPESLQNAHDCMTIQEACRAYTSGAAFAAGEENSKGSLEIGKLADFIALSEDIFAGNPEKILTTKIVATYVGARRVFSGE